MSVSEEQIDNATKIVAYYTLAATATGAVPVPAASAVIVAESASMLAHIASVLGIAIDISTVLESLTLMGTLNVLGRTLFIEGARLLSWGTGSIWAFPALSVFGATTAGVQTYIIGRLAIEIGKNQGNPLNPSKANSIVDEAKRNYLVFFKEWQKKNPPKPDMETLAK
jgi:uncharacterized protein (DUF697 family)